MWSVENYLQEDKLLSNMKTAAYFILLYEHFEDMIVGTVHKVYSTPCVLDGKLYSNIDDEYINLLTEKAKQGESCQIPYETLLSDARRAKSIYQKEVISEKKKGDAQKFRGSLDWLQKQDVISEAENNRIMEIRKRRNKIVHELLQEIGSGLPAEDVQMIVDLLNFQQRVNAWRFQQIDMPIMEIELPEDANPNDVMGSDDVILNGIFRILFCGEGENFKEALNKELKNETPI